MKTIITALIAAFILQSCNQPSIKENVAQEVTQEELVSRGKYLTEILDCATCHSPKVMTPQGPVPDTSLLMSGHPSAVAIPYYNKDLIFKDGWVLMSGTLTAFVGPWGESYAANITPAESGIGSWTSEQFNKALKHGLYKGLDGSRPLMPPMPVSAFSHLNDQDVDAIFAYLRTLKPVENVVPAYKPFQTQAELVTKK